MEDVGLPAPRPSDKPGGLCDLGYGYGQTLHGASGAQEEISPGAIEKETQEKMVVRRRGRGGSVLGIWKTKDIRYRSE